MQLIKYLIYKFIAKQVFIFCTVLSTAELYKQTTNNYLNKQDKKNKDKEYK